MIVDSLIGTAKVSLGYRADITIGGKEPGKVIPNVNISFNRDGDDSRFANINAVDVDVLGDEDTLLLEDIISVKTTNRIDKWYETVDGRLEYEIILNTPPVNRFLQFTIKCSPDVVFAEQTLSAEQIADGDTYTADDIPNSFAAYCSERHNSFRNGKLFHIFRSWVEDKDNNRCWVQQVISFVKTGEWLWEIEIPEEIYLDEKLYPLLIGPIVGYDTMPTLQQSANTRAYSIPVTVPAGGVTATGFYAYHRNAFATAFECGHYTDSSGSPSSLVSSAAGSRTGNLISSAYSGDLDEGAKHLAIVATSGQLALLYENSGGANSANYTANEVSALPASWSSDGTNIRYYAFWVEYSVASPGNWFLLGAQNKLQGLRGING
jgi:hypothetical protein